MTKRYDKIISDNIINVGTSKYKLKSIIAHHGEESNHGHYKFSIHNDNGDWCLFDDSTSKQSNEDKDIPYMLFYGKFEQNNNDISKVFWMVTQKWSHFHFNTAPKEEKIVTLKKLPVENVMFILYSKQIRSH